MADELKPIRATADYEKALAEVQRLWGAKSATPEGDRLDVLATLIDAYETEHYPIDPPDPVEAIKFRMEQQGLTRKDLEEIIGTRTRGRPKSSCTLPLFPNVSGAGFAAVLKVMVPSKVPLALTTDTMPSL